MGYEVTVGSLGDGVEEAYFATWLKAVGESVEVGEPIAEVMTDKVNLEIESPVSGVLASVECEPEDTVKVGQVIAVIRETDA